MYLNKSGPATSLKTFEDVKNMLEQGWTHVWPHVNMSKHIFTCPNTCLNRFENIRTYLCTSEKFVDVWTHLLFMDKFLHIWTHLYMSEQIFTCLNTFICTCLYTFVHFNKIKHIWSKQNTFKHVWTHLKISENISTFLNTFEHVWTNLHMSEPIKVYH